MKELQKVKGITEVRLKKLNNLGINSLYELINYKPLKHVDMSEIRYFSDVDVNELAICQVKITDKPTVRFIKKNMNITDFTVTDGITKIKCFYFNQPYIAKKDITKDYILIGNLKVQNGRKQFINPVLEPLEKFEAGIIPFYSVKKELNQKLMRTLIQNGLDYCDKNNLFSDIPYIDLTNTLRMLHFPKNKEELELACKKLKYFEAVCLSCAIDLISPDSQKSYVSYNFNRETFLEQLPFELTDGQKQAISDIDNDLKQGKLMNRLVQGDVGCGKTMVAIYALYIAGINGYQSAFVCPTEVLANQNFKITKELLSKFDLNVELLTSSTPNKTKQDVLQRLKTGKIDVIVGTHSLLQDNVEFNNLNMFVTDEQHRFGVKQRAKLIDNCHTLIMSATPIPRTLALIAFNKLDISVIKELPKGRLPVKTHIIYPHKKNDMYNFIYNECKNGNQAYIVCPLIDESESIQAVSATGLYTELKQKYKDVRVELMHSKLKQVEKDEIINLFKEGTVQVLVSTTVIEVGVDVPNATIMVIENSERFGLAALHQLRGRVGRGNKQSYCFACLKDDVNNERIKIFKENTNGLELAKMDLSLRGTGELVGFNQHGKWLLEYLDFNQDANVLIQAIDDVTDLKGTNSFNQLQKIVELKYKDILSEIALN